MRLVGVGLVGVDPGSEVVIGREGELMGNRQQSSNEMRTVYYAPGFIVDFPRTEPSIFRGVVNQL
jgi:hypothetical protein